MSIDASKVKTGDILTIVHYVKVKNRSGNKVSVIDLDTSLNFDINGEPLIQRCQSSDQVSSTKKVSKTEAAEILVGAYNKPLTVCFEKADGSERVLRGRLVKPEPLLGRSMVEDLDIENSEKMRLVDHRTLKWIIVDNTKYEIKK